MPKNYLITGAARGIGRGLSRLLLQQGHHVFLVDNNSDELRHLSTKLHAHHPTTQWHTHTADLCDTHTIAGISSAAHDFFAGRLDVLVHNAADTTVAGGVDLSDARFPEAWATAVAVNLSAPVLLTRACREMLRDGGGGGSVVMVSSTRARQSEAASEAYAATKAGLLGLTHALACSLAADRVRVNAVLPGWVNVAHECRDGDERGLTWADGLSEDDHRWHWTGRVGMVEDVLKAVEYLSAGEFVTGTEMVVDGGVSRRMVYPE